MDGWRCRCWRQAREVHAEVTREKQRIRSAWGASSSNSRAGEGCRARRGLAVLKRPGYPWGPVRRLTPVLMLCSAVLQSGRSAHRHRPSAPCHRLCPPAARAAATATAQVWRGHAPLASAPRLRSPHASAYAIMPLTGAALTGHLPDMEVSRSGSIQRRMSGFSTNRSAQSRDDAPRNGARLALLCPLPSERLPLRVPGRCR